MRIFVLAIALVLAVGCGPKKGEDYQPYPKLYNDRQQRTPLGNVIASRDGVSAEFIAAADNAIWQVTEDAKAIYGPRPELHPGGYAVYVLPDCTPSPVYGTRSFKVNGILAAEWVVDLAAKRYAVCAAPAVDQELRNALRYGPEHLILYQTDRPEFDRTADPCCHQHPLIRSREAAR